MADTSALGGKRETAEARREQAFSLRKAGASYRAIGRQLGISECQAHHDVRAVLARIRKLTDETAEEYVKLEEERLDTAILAIAKAVQNGHLGAVEAWRKLSESRRKLLGLDAPQELKHSGGIAVGTMDLDNAEPTELRTRLADAAARLLPGGSDALREARTESEVDGEAG